MAKSRKEKYREYLKSEEWAVRRAVVMKRDRNKCRDCNGDAHDVHHLTYERIFEELSSDLVALCRPCHELRHDVHPNKRTRKKRNKKGKRFANVPSTRHHDENAEAFRKRVSEIKRSQQPKSRVSRKREAMRKKFKCPLCKKKARRPDFLISHFQAAHPDHDAGRLLGQVVETPPTKV